MIRFKTIYLRHDALSSNRYIAASFSSTATAHRVASGVIYGEPVAVSAVIFLD